MDKVELYREVFASFRTLCAERKQPSSFNAYCKAHGVEQSLMRHILKDEFQNVKALSGFQFSRSAGDHAVGKICSQIYEEFKRLCAEGRQPGTFKAYWKTQARMTPGAKVDLTPENNLFLTPEEFGRRGQFYFGLSAFEGFEFTDAFAGERDTVCGVRCGRCGRGWHPPLWCRRWRRTSPVRGVVM